jgi:low affinity Fe/Cu permease
MTHEPTMPSEVSSRVGFFDRFAEGASRLASRAWFFCFCVILVLLWAPSIVVLKSIDTWQLIINTATTIITFLMVALLQNSQTRADQAVQHKLNAIADALSDLLAGEQDEDARELRDAVGLEERESTSDNTADDGADAAGEDEDDGADAAGEDEDDGADAAGEDEDDDEDADADEGPDRHPGSPTATLRS